VLTVLLRVATPAHLAAMPQIRRGAPDARGRCAYTVRMRADVDVAITVRDPLARTLEQGV
jgi:hypothetical protein